ncbi:MAG: hypothetical protein WCA81_10375 [Rhizomicrobium sp.]
MALKKSTLTPIVPFIATLGYLLLFAHLAISFSYWDYLTSIGLGDVTSKILGAYAIGSLLMMFGAGLRFFRRDADVLFSTLCLILSIPFLWYRLAPELFQSLTGGYWAAPGKYMTPEPLAGADLAVIFSYVVTSTLRGRQRCSAKE